VQIRRHLHLEAVSNSHKLRFQSHRSVAKP
jgi:hypothetical protein